MLFVFFVLVKVVRNLKKKEEEDFSIKVRKLTQLVDTLGDTVHFVELLLLYRHVRTSNNIFQNGSLQC